MSQWPSILVNKFYTHCCCFVVAMASLKREAERRGKAAANTGPSTSNEGRVNSGAEETLVAAARYNT
ncbi:hypothetical protein T4E_4499 [Trichinella pseudospiralis]|uniref:Uncharacterized protein n=1 Tax=Trichinella pseudospiralis TaxID=6337 RepID=A0A0V0XIK0_TRIPS|nr:hypothetical protein T4E_4499 [Trichinella pseudospiralis]